MKRFIYISAIMCINIFLMGALCKISHWPGAAILLTIGMGLTAVMVLPLAIYNAYLESDNKDFKWVYLTGFICAFIDILGALFKIQHYPGASILLLLGIPLPFVVFLPVFVRAHMKRKDEQMNGFLSVMFLMTYIVVFTALLAVRA